ncbi:MAG: hypothetical protein WBP22_01175 [Candidatus Saccharimonas sp.]
MPRRNRQRPITKLPSSRTAEAGKIRYASRASAEQQIREQQKYQPDLKLSTYQSPTDGGWYLTSR